MGCCQGSNHVQLTFFAGAAVYPAARAEAEATHFAAGSVDEVIAGSAAARSAGAARTAAAADEAYETAAADAVYAVLATAAYAAAAAVSADMAFLEGAAAPADLKRHATQLASQPLWPQGAPDWAVDAWAKLKADLLAIPDENWRVWTDWYDARLEGRRSKQKLELARVKLPDELWKEGPAAVNQAILDLMRPKRGVPLKQRPATHKFKVVNDKVDVLPEDAVPHSADLAADYHAEARRKAAALQERLNRMQADAILRENVKLLLDRLSQSDLRPGLVLSSLRSLDADYDNSTPRKAARNCRQAHCRKWPISPAPSAR